MRQADPADLVAVWLAGVACWGHRWTSNLGELPVDDDGELTVAGGMWAAALAGYPKRCILDALAAFVNRGEAWPPALAELRKQCAGIPSLAEVRREFALSYEMERTRFSRLVWSLLDSWAYGRADRQTADRMLAEAYAQAVEHVLSGGALPEHSLAVGHAPAPVRVATREAAQPHLDAIAALLGARRPEDRL